MQQNRVVVTGLGLVSPLGCSVDYVWNRLCQGISGIGGLPQPEYAKLPARIAGQVPRRSISPRKENTGNSREIEIPADNTFEEYARLTNAELHRMSTSSAFALAAANEAVKNSRLDLLSSAAKQDRAGTAIGTGMVDLVDVVDTNDNLRQSYSRVSPFFVSKILPNSPAGIVSLRHQLRGANLAPSTACATGLHAIIEAYLLLRHDHCDIMVCGGTEACISPLSLAGFARMRALSTRYNDEPERASRPFDKNRDGFVMAEGAAILVLECLHHALRRGARIYAEILGFGLTADAHHMTAPPDGATGALRAMQMAVNQASVSVGQIGHVNAHATSTPQGDAAELKAIDRLICSSPETLTSEDTVSSPVMVTSTKGATGHLLGASGAIEALFTVMSCYSGLIPPTLNCSEIDIDHSGRLRVVQGNSACVWQPPVDNSNRRIAITNSFGFGGTNAALCVAEYIE